MEKVPIVVTTVLSAMLLTTSVIADSAVDLRQVGEFYRASRHFEAEEVCKRILSDPSSDPEAVYQACRILPLVYLRTERLSEMPAAVQQLLIRASGHEYLPEALHEIIQQAKDIKKAPEAGQICRDLLRAKPQPSQVILLKMGVAIADVYLTNDSAVDSDVKDIIAHDAADPWAAEALAQIGWAYEKLNMHGKARPLYEYVVQNWPNKPRAMYAHTALVRSCIRVNDKPAARANVEQLIRRYSADTDLPNVLNDIARGYREARMYEDAKPVSRYVLDHSSEDSQRIWAERDVILCDIGLRNKEPLQANVQKLVQCYAQEGNLPYVLNEIARIAREAGLYELAKPISRYILDIHPGNDQCIWARRDLILCGIAQQDQEGADAGLQRLLKDHARDGFLPYVLCEISDQCRNARMHTQARSLCQYVLDNHPTSNHCMWAQTNVVLSNLALRDMDAARTGAQTLLAKYGKQDGALWAISHVAETYSAMGQHEQARDLYQFNLGTAFNFDDRIWSLRSYLAESVALKDEAGIDASIKKLFKEYVAGNNLPMAAVHMGRELCLAGDSRALDLFQYVIDKRPEDGQALLARVGTGHVRLIQGQDGQVEALYQQILEKYRSHPMLPEAVQLMAEAYYDCAQRAEKQGDTAKSRLCMEAAIAKSRIITEQLKPETDAMATAQFFEAECYRRIGQYDSAIQLYRGIVAEWPEHANAASSAFMIGDCYQRMKHAGVMSESDADAATSTAYAQLVQAYPQSAGARAARIWLQNKAMAEGGAQ